MKSLLKLIKKIAKILFVFLLINLCIFIAYIIYGMFTLPRVSDDPVYKANMAYAKQSAEAKILAEQIARNVCTTNKLKFLMLGRIGESRKCSEIISFVGYGTQALNIDEVKTLTRKVTKTYIDAVQNSPEIIKAFEMRPVHRLDLTQPMFQPEYLSIRISFWDSYDNRQRTPYIAEIRLDDGILRYYTTKTSNTDEIELLNEEPL